MTSPKLKATRLIAPVLLASSAFLVACGKSPGDDLHGMTDAIAAACPVNNKTTQDKLNCATVGKQQADALFKYAELEKKFGKACTYKDIPASIPDMARPLILGSQVLACLGLTEGAAADPTVKETARRIKQTVQAGIL